MQLSPTSKKNNLFFKFLVQYGILIEVELEGRSSLPLPCVQYVVCHKVNAS